MVYSGLTVDFFFIFFYEDLIKKIASLAWSTNGWISLKENEISYVLWDPSTSFTMSSLFIDSLVHVLREIMNDAKVRIIASLVCMVFVV